MSPAGDGTKHAGFHHDSVWVETRFFGRARIRPHSRTTLIGAMDVPATAFKALKFENACERELRAILPQESIPCRADKSEQTEKLFPASETFCQLLLRTSLRSACSPCKIGGVSICQVASDTSN